MKVHIPMIIKTLGSDNLLVALPDYPRPVVMNYQQFEREKRKYPEW
tara:strand:+ start:681 stop:818 length:138 start_codon:yes stop_codon:yes gene_type:complete